jgi:hypothetical protein
VLFLCDHWQLETHLLNLWISVHMNMECLVVV